MRPRDLSALHAYHAGRGVEAVARERNRDPAEFIIMSSNENPEGPSPDAIEAIKRYAERANRYPKSAHTALRTALAGRWKVDVEQLWLAAGGVGALDYLTRAFVEPGDTILVSDPGFPYHARTARFHHAEVDTYPLNLSDGYELSVDSILSRYDDQRMVFMTSPHNPTGQTVSRSVIESIANATDEETLIVVDEAYGEYSTTPSAVDLVAERDDLAVIRTLSKAYGLAGCRIGYAIVPMAWADAYSRVATPFAVNEIGCRAGLAAIADVTHVERVVANARWARTLMHERLTARTWSSEGNFVLAEVGDASSVALTLESQGVIVRECTSFGLPSCIRITTGTRDETEAAVGIINEVTATS